MLRPVSSALVKFLDGISDDEIVELEIPTGVPSVYELDKQLRPVARYYLGESSIALQAQEELDRVVVRVCQEANGFAGK